ncbi:MAG TPA: ABC transporter permease [Candidatus Paceibacterota bacterium]|nr:ABC transporter permease [Candidatus Paceibacterota bacterium]
MNFLTEFKEGLSISWGAIRANKMRSVLTTLGIVIGVVTVTLMGTAIQGLNRAFVNSISFIGADVLYVQREEWFIKSHAEWMKMHNRPKLTLAQVKELQRQFPSAVAIAPTADSRETVKFQKRSADNVTIIGTSADFFTTSGVSISRGRFLTAGECDGGRPVCVIGATVATNLFQGNPEVGNRIIIDDRNFDVVGVLEKQGGFLGEGGVDNQIIVGLPVFRAAFRNNPDYTVQVKVKQVEQLEDAKEELHSTMRKIRRLAPTDPDDFSINQQDQVLDMFHKVAGTIAAVGLFVTSLSLFVGGIGIMNIMFVSVAERTREIGIRKAIGAKRRTILLQFLLEAASICLIGGLVALAIAWPLTLLMQKFLPASLSLTVVGIALAVSLVTGVISGFFPAWRAARMNPVDALRSE